MNAFGRIVAEIAESQKASGDRAYERFKAMVLEGKEIGLTDHELVLVISKAIWARELATAQLALSELEVRTAVDASRMAERRHVA